MSEMFKGIAFHVYNMQQIVQDSFMCIDDFPL